MCHGQIPKKTHGKHDLKSKFIIASCRYFITTGKNHNFKLENGFSDSMSEKGPWMNITHTLNLKLERRIPILKLS